MSACRVVLEHHERSVNAAAGHWSWLCEEHEVGTVATWLGDLTTHIDSHVRSHES